MSAAWPNGDESSAAGAPPTAPAGGVEDFKPSALDVAAPGLFAQSESTAPPPRYELRVVQALRQIVHGVELYSKRMAAPSQITLPQLACLHSVVSLGPLTAGAIGRQIHLSASTVVGILDRLEEKGLVLRERDRHDRRVVHISATPKGCEVAARAPSPLQQHLAEAITALPELEQATIALALERVVEFMEKGVAQVKQKPVAPEGAHPEHGPPRDD